MYITWIFWSNAELLFDSYFVLIYSECTGLEVIFINQKKIVEFLAFWVANTVALLVLSLIFKNNVVLGNAKVSMPMAAVVCGFILTLVGAVVDPIVRKSGFVEGLATVFKSAGMKMKDEAIWGILYLVVNIIAVWVIKKFALVLGLGVSSILFTLIVAIVVTGAGWAVAVLTGASKEGKK
ncbi:MAG TPA: hypothetical protein VLE91_00700 [Candidatus Saccharimonadales bacterium]|nr:hypothetical protein [Candidatus Saccharimonadales bacterium]